MGRYKNAAADFDSTLAVYPRHSLAILNKGIALGRLGRHEEAIDLLSLAVTRISPAEYDGARMTGFMHRGNAFKTLGMYEEAIEDYRRAKDVSRLAARACWRIAQCYSLQKNYATAILWLNRSLSHGFGDLHLWQRDRELAPLWNTPEFRELFR
jgi:tetratricopeptide (TPR) repeat protein